MPEEGTTKQETTGANPEPVEHQESKASADDSLDSMLARIPSLSGYFGEATESAEKPAEPEEPPSGESPPEEPVAEPEISVEGEAKEEEKKQREELSPSVQKRIDKLTAQKHSALEKAEALEAKVRELEAKASEPVPQVSTSDSPLANVDTVEKLDQQLADARKVKNWALENLDGGEVAGKDGVTEYWDGSKVKKYLAWSEALITEHIPQRRAYLDNRKQFDAEAAKSYPNSAKTGTEENSVLNAWVKIFPAVQRFPDYKLIIMDALAGQKIRLAKSKVANGQKVTRNTPTLSAPSPASGSKVEQRKGVLSKDLLNRIATDRSALDVFSESLIGGE